MALLYPTVSGLTGTETFKWKVEYDYGDHFYRNGEDYAAQTLTIDFYESYDSVKEDKLRLPAAVFTQFVHLESDAFTKQGLPVPILEAFSEELAGKLYRSQYDSLCLLRDIKIVGVQAVVSVVINMLITLIHGLFYDPAKHGDRELFEVRTRKILLYSNAMASA